MIGWIKGQLLDDGSDGTIIVDVSGVGYELFVPVGTLGLLGKSKLNPDGDPEDTTVELHVHTHVREDALALYGFATKDDRTAFRALLSVSSIGPKLALSVLGKLDARALSRAVATEDRAALKGISGVGKKTVERILLDLKDKLLIAPKTMGAKVVPIRATSGSDGDEALIGALVTMGYKRGEAERAVFAIESREGKSAENLMREALAGLR